jgi:hypothetical protein
MSSKYFAHPIAAFAPPKIGVLSGCCPTPKRESYPEKMGFKDASSFSKTHAHVGVPRSAFFILRSGAAGSKVTFHTG